MKRLLDTHIFLWFISGDERLPEAVKAQIRNSENEVYLSVVSSLFGAGLQTCAKQE